MGTPVPDESRSLWMESPATRSFSPLRESTTTDVCVVGAGIAGLTAALELSRRGLRVLVLEADEVGGGVTGHTTGKVAALHGLVYDELRSKWGEEGAKVYAQAQLDALAFIRGTVEGAGIDCDWRDRDAYTYVVERKDVGAVEAEVDAAQRAGLAAEFVVDTPLPYVVAAAIRLPGQAEFDARRYCLGLAELLIANGARIHEGSRATGLTERGEFPAVHVGDLRVGAEHVVVASHMPFPDRGGFFVRLTAKRSYAIAKRATGPVPEGMFISAGSTPTRSMRGTPDGRGGELLVIGGEGHNAGEHGGSTPDRYERLAAFGDEFFGDGEVTHRWSSQDLQPADGLPYVGPLTPLSKRVFVASGFRKWGLTNGTAAAFAIADAITGVDNAFGKLTYSWRVTPRKSAVNLAKEGFKDGRHMVGDRLRPPSRKGVDALGPGEGALMRHDGQTVAAARDLDGTLHVRSPVCTHLGCRVLWNKAERSWDCPCHGSRFATDGAVLEGPATRPLAEAGKGHVETVTSEVEAS